MNIQSLDFSVDLLANLLWQYNEAARLQALIESKQAWVTRVQTDFWTDWVRDVFDLQTANDFGLSVWAVILDMPLTVAAQPDNNKPIWGFGAGVGNPRVNFNRGNFAATSSAFGLTTEQKRLVLRLRYFQLTTRATAPEANAIMNAIFGPGVAYVVDVGGMRARYVFTVPPPAAVELVLIAYDLLPRPAAVLVDYVISGEANGWGFGRYHTNFTNGNFYHA